jgi:hypothetical protein
MAADDEPRLRDLMRELRRRHQRQRAALEALQQALDTLQREHTEMKACFPVTEEIAGQEPDSLRASLERLERLLEELKNRQTSRESAALVQRIFGKKKRPARRTPRKKP